MGQTPQITLPAGSHVRLYLATPLSFVLVAPPGTKAEPDMLFKTGLAGLIHVRQRRNLAGPQRVCRRDGISSCRSPNLPAVWGSGRRHRLPQTDAGAGAMTARSRAALEAGVNQITAEAAGVLHLMIVRRDDLHALLADAMGGSSEARALIVTLQQAMSKIVSAPRNKPLLCVSCPRPLRGGRYSFAMVMPACDDPTQAVTMAVCYDCAISPDGIKSRAVAGLKMIWPNARAIEISLNRGGRA